MRVSCYEYVNGKSKMISICPQIGDLYEEDQILNWLMTQKDPGGDVIEDLEGERLISLIEESGSMAVYFCKCLYVFHTFNEKFCKQKNN